jgi:hypothetical protein
MRCVTLPNAAKWGLVAIAGQADKGKCAAQMEKHAIMNDVTPRSQAKSTSNDLVT